MRLHPILDGVMPIDPADRRPVTTRDRFGQPLTDVHDGNGFCTGVRSNMVAAAGSSVITPSGVGGSPTGSCPNVVEVAEGTYVDMSNTIRTDGGDVYGLVVRTVEMGDAPLPVSRVRMARRPSDADEAVRAAVRLMGYKGPVTSKMRKAILDMIALEVAAQAVTDNRTV